MKYKEIINNVRYNTAYATCHKVVEDNMKRQSICYMTTNRGKDFIYLKNPYKQPFEVIYDTGEVIIIHSKERIIPVINGDKSIENYWKENIV